MSRFMDVIKAAKQQHEELERQSQNRDAASDMAADKILEQEEEDNTEERPAENGHKMDGVLLNIQQLVADKRSDYDPNRFSDIAEQRKMNQSQQLVKGSDPVTQRCSGKVQKSEQSNQGADKKQSPGKRIPIGQLRSVHLIENIQENTKFKAMSTSRTKDKRISSQTSNARSNQSSANINSKEKLYMYAKIVQQEISFNTKVQVIQKVLRDNLYFSKFLHPTNLEFLAAAAQVIDSANYEKNILLGSGKLPEITVDKVERGGPQYEVQYLGERSQEQNITKLFNPHEDYVHVLSGSMKITIQDMNVDNVIDSSSNTVLELHQGDFIDPTCPLHINYFKSQRLLNINQLLREQRVKSITIQHNVMKSNVRVFYIEGKYHTLYTKNKNYLSVFSKDQIDSCLLECFPSSVDLQTEKRKKQLKEILKFDILAPNTLLTLEGQSNVPIAYLILFGNIRFFKHDKLPEEQISKNAGQERRIPIKNANVQDNIKKQTYGRLVSNVQFNDTKTSECKLFFGFEASLEDDFCCPYTIVTSSSDLTVVYKVLPDQLKELLRHEKSCIKAILRRFINFYHTVNDMRKTSLKGQDQQDQLLSSGQIQKVDYSNIEQDFKYGSQRIIQTYKDQEKRNETGLQRPLLEENFKDVVINTSKRQSRGALTLSRMQSSSETNPLLLMTQQSQQAPPKKPKLDEQRKKRQFAKKGAITEEDICNLQRRRQEIFQDLGPLKKKADCVYLIGENVDPGFVKNMNTEQKKNFQAMLAESENFQNFKKEQDRKLKERLARGLPPPKCPWIKRIPPEIDILNDYRRKFDIKRQYATPIPERSSKLRTYFIEEFYNKIRIKDVYKDENGVEQAPSPMDILEQKRKKLTEMVKEQLHNVNTRKLGSPQVYYHSAMLSASPTRKKQTIKLGCHNIPINYKNHQIAPIHDFEEVKQLGSTGTGGALKFQQIASQFRQQKQKMQKDKASDRQAETTTAMTSNFFNPFISTFGSEFNLNNNSIMNLTGKKFNLFTSQANVTPLISADNSKAQYHQQSLRLNVFSSQDSKRSTALGSLRHSELLSRQNEEADKAGQKVSQERVRASYVAQGGNVSRSPQLKEDPPVSIPKTAGTMLRGVSPTTPDSGANDPNFEPSRNTSIRPANSSLMNQSKYDNMNGIQKGEASVVVLNSDVAHALSRGSAGQQAADPAAGHNPMNERSIDDVEVHRFRAIAHGMDNPDGVRISDTYLRSSQQDQNYKSQEYSPLMTGPFHHNQSAQARQEASEMSARSNMAMYQKMQSFNQFFMQYQFQEQNLNQSPFKASEQAAQSFRMTSRSFPKRKVLQEGQKYKLVNQQQQNDYNKRKTPMGKKGSSMLGKYQNQYKNQSTGARCSSPQSIIETRNFRSSFRHYDQSKAPQRITSIDLMMRQQNKDVRFQSTQLPAGFDRARGNAQGRAESRNGVGGSPGRRSSTQQRQNEGTSQRSNTNYSRKSQKALIGVLNQIIQPPADSQKYVTDVRNSNASDGSLQNQSRKNSSLPESKACLDNVTPRNASLSNVQNPILSRRPKNIHQSNQLQKSTSKNTEYASANRHDEGTQVQSGSPFKGRVIESMVIKFDQANDSHDHDDSRGEDYPPIKEVKLSVLKQQEK